MVMMSAVADSLMSEILVTNLLLISLKVGGRLRHGNSLRNDTIKNRKHLTGIDVNSYSQPGISHAISLYCHLIYCCPPLLLFNLFAADFDEL